MFIMILLLHEIHDKLFKNFLKNSPFNCFKSNTCSQTLQRPNSHHKQLYCQKRILSQLLLSIYISLSIYVFSISIYFSKSIYAWKSLNSLDNDRMRRSREHGDKLTKIKRWKLNLLTLKYYRSQQITHRHIQMKKQVLKTWRCGTMLLQVWLPHVKGPTYGREGVREDVWNTSGSKNGRDYSRALNKIRSR